MTKTSEETEILFRYHEIALKGDNRGWFEKKLAENTRLLIHEHFGKEYPVSVQRIHSRIILKTRWNAEIQELLQKCLFGLSSLSPMVRVETHLDVITQKTLELVRLHIQEFGCPKSFRVFTKRSEKALPETSMEIDRIIGAVILQAFPALTVNLTKPAYQVGIEIRAHTSFLWTERVRGPGGLPVGTHGAVLCLISGGFDSPVAAIQMIKRGSPVRFIHFYGTPYVGEEALLKVQALVRRVNRYQPLPQALYIIPFGKIQEKIALVTHPKYRTLLYRRMMIRIAHQLAQTLKIQALVTGESLGQVASQTLENLSLINQVSPIPILRPLISFDKDEILERARHWETHDTSVLPAADCCTLFADRHPVLRGQIDSIDQQEQQFSVPDLIQEALAHLTVWKQSPR